MDQARPGRCDDVDHRLYIRELFPRRAARDICDGRVFAVAIAEPIDPFNRHTAANSGPLVIHAAILARKNGDDTDL